MSLGSLDFGAPPGGTLAFGAGGTSGPTPADLGIDAGLGEFTADLALGRGVAFSIDAGLGEFECDIEAAFYVTVSRPGARHGIRMHWQDGKRAAAAASTRWQDSAPVLRPAATRWQDGAAAKSAAAARWQDNAAIRFARATRWQDADPLRAAIAQRWQETERFRRTLSASWQDAAAVRMSSQQHWQDNTRLRRTAAARWQDAAALRRLHLEAAYDATPVRHFQRTHWQDARKPPPGRSWHTIPPEPPHLCYDPADLGKLQFGLDTSALGVLAFWCRDDETPGGETIIVPVRRVYIVINNTYLTRVSDGAPIPVHSMGLSLDAGSWTWGFDATLPAVAQALVEPTANGPVELAAFVNGMEFRVLAEEISSERVFLSKQIRVAGRGANARLDSPFAPQQIFANTAMRTTEQLMGDVLTINGVPFGYSVDYQLTPWVVPAGGFVHLGTYISALTAIANAGGGYLRPHPSLQKFDVLHRYPTAPWEPVTPGIILPAAVTTRESITWVEKPDYNRVFVSGQNAGVLGDVRRQGTAFDKAAPMVVDALITDAAAAQQKGLEVLGNTGRQYEVGLRLPVLAQTGVIQPGVYVQYVDGAITRTGIVRSTQVEVGEIDVYQTIGVEVRG